jgi:imidazolonepropionase
MDLVIKNIGQLLTMRGGKLGIIKDGKVGIDQGKIAFVGKKSYFKNVPTIDARGLVVMPGFVDCHTHLVFAGYRADEFERRLLGASYKTITQRGGGILATVKKTRRATREELFTLAQGRIDEMIKWGTTTVEVKSGYGLSVKDELKILEVIERLQLRNKVTIVSTFLGAHAVPKGTDKKKYIETIITKMIPEVAKRGLARFCDVFCENFVFNHTESEQILRYAREFGLVPKIHADEIESSNGAVVAGRVKAASADHLLVPSLAGLKLMKKNKVVAVLLPGTSLFLQAKKRPPIAALRRLDLTIAIGSDYNPGSCMINQMPIIIGLACLLYGLTISEALIGATLNGASALQLENRIGSLETGKDADIVILDIPDYRQIPYQFGRNPVKTVIKKGEIIHA